MASLARFERLDQPLAPRAVFLRRLGRNVFVALAGVAVSLVIGMAGYHWLGGLPWIDAFQNASMILSGMGPVDPMPGFGAKLFAGLYALYSGLFVVATTGLILAPVAHRVLHGLHVPAEDDEAADEKAEDRKKHRKAPARGKPE